jgi:hypothetical protein
MLPETTKMRFSGEDENGEVRIAELFGELTKAQRADPEAVAES